MEDRDRCDRWPFRIEASVQHGRREPALSDAVRVIRVGLTAISIGRRPRVRFTTGGNSERRLHRLPRMIDGCPNIELSMHAHDREKKALVAEIDFLGFRLRQSILGLRPAEDA